MRDDGRFGAPTPTPPNRGGGIEQCFTSQPRDEIPSIDTSDVTNIAVTPGAKPCNVIVGCNTLEGVAVNYRCAVRLMLTL